MKIPYVSEKAGLVVMIVLVLGMMAYGLYKWPEGKSHKELLLDNQRKADSLKALTEPEAQN